MLRCINKQNGGFMRHSKVNCPKCEMLVGNNNIKKHTIICEGKKKCPVCEKEYIGKSKTCSYSCSNKHFRTGESNGNWKQDSYQSTCWLHHGKKCLVCGEEKIVTVHHVNGNHNDNRVENLVPLCPTHHQYVHSRYKNEVLPIVEKYVENYLLGVG